MKDLKALQSGTSHYFGDKFSRAYDCLLYTSVLIHGPADVGYPACLRA